MAEQPTEITLEHIAFMKAEKRKEIELQKEKIADAAQALFAPVKPAANKAESLARLFNKGMAVFDGFMLGMKTINAFRAMFRRRKSKDS